MLKTIPNHWFTWNCEVLEGNAPVASIYFNAWGEAGELFFEGFRYRVYRQGPLSGTFILQQDDNSIAWAEKPNPLFRMFSVNYGGHQYELKAKSPFGRTFVLHEYEQIVGSIYPEHAFTRRAIIDLPESIPLVVRIFMVWLVMILWRRQQRQSSTASAGGGSYASRM
jgi:hypothetical protein